MQQLGSQELFCHFVQLKTGQERRGRMGCTKKRANCMIEL